MPGGKGFVDSPSWFEDCFGFKEAAFKETRKHFEFAEGVLSSKPNGAQFHVGPFEIPSLTELRARHGALAGGELGGLSFENVTGSAKTLHLEARNAGAVFQVASQFNCLEMNEPGARPEDGVTRYYCDATQGPACALACPAATVYRNYLVNDGAGQAGGRQIDCLSDVGETLQNAKRKYWKMKNGYCWPEERGSLGSLAKALEAAPDLAEAARASLRIGIHWDTEVKGGSHRVCQVFASAVPVAYTKTLARANEWEPFARLVLDGAYEATLAAAAVIAAERQTRVVVFLTAVGGGAFGNRSFWITQAMERALVVYKDAPLDVKLVHFGSVPRGAYASLEKGRRGSAGAPRPAAKAAPAAPAVPAAPAPAPAAATAPGAGPDDVAERLVIAFGAWDVNGDGVIDREEMARALKELDAEVFTDENIAKAFEAADANGDGEVHYAEFVAWVCRTDPELTSRVLRFADATAALAADT